MKDTTGFVDKTSIIDAMFRKQMDAAFNFARLMHTGMGNG